MTLTKPVYVRLFGKFVITSTVFVACFSISLVLGLSTRAQAQGGAFNYGEALQKSIFFYDAQRSGTLPANNRVNWRGNSGTTDGADVSLDLTGGFYDAGDHVKFGLPMAYTTTILSWSMLEYPQAFSGSGQNTALMNNIRWATDYFIKAHPSPNVLYGQVGDGNLDHAFWGPPEVMQMARPAKAITSTCPGSDLAGETAAAMAAASMVFKTSDPTYSATLLQHAKDLYNFADTFRGKYSDCITGAQGFYTSFSGFNDELVWGAIWLYKATGDVTYLNKAIAGYASLGNQTGQTVKSYKWTLGWDDKSFGCYLLLAKLTNQTQYMQDTERWLNWWTAGGNANGADGTKITYSPGGEAWLDVWGSLRYAATTSFAALVYSDFITDSVLKQRYHDFAVNQINYILGNNPLHRSFVVGFGTNPVLNVHHRAAHSSWSNNILDPVNNRHVIYGAMAGGPNSANDQFIEDRQQFQMAEAADDYNAGLVAALARLYQEFGGAPLANFPQPETPSNNELYIQAAQNAAGTNFTEVKALVTNQTGWPPRVTDKLTLRYFFTLDGTTTPSQITLTQNFSQCGNSILSGPTQWSGNIYYVTASCVGTKIYPGGQENFKKEIQFRMASAGTWDPTNDPSFQGLPPAGGTPVTTSAIVLYDNGVRVWGTEPGTNPCALVPATPSGLTAVPVSSTQINLAWTAVTAPANCTVTYSVFRSTTTGFTPSASNQIASGLSGPTSFSDTGLTASTAYFYVVEALDAAGASAPSAQATATTMPPASCTTVPAAPTGVTATSASSSQINVAWTAVTAPANCTVTYDVFQSTTSGFTASATNRVATGLTTAAFPNTGLTPSTSYFFLVRAVDAAGPSASSTEATATTQPPMTDTGGVTVTPVVSANSPYFNDEAIRLTNTAAVTGLSITIVLQRTAGLSFNGQYNTVGNQITQANSATSLAITYTFSQSAGTLVPGNYLFAAQAGGTGTAHPTAGDTYTVTYTTGGTSFTQTGHF